MPLIRALSYAGLIPFVGIAIATHTTNFMAYSESHRLFTLYSCLILGFMSGVLWPVLFNAKKPSWMAILAISFPVISFLSLALLEHLALLIQAGLFLALRLFEWACGIDKRYPRGYPALRWKLTAVVCLTHIVMLI
ncbi:DUF3429 domain-containing protein [Nitrincola sp. MINF-07-Sa-05]|uniref:DUF3429 domain-containing protein n=1 Tax=Nitrincola salilacus TaxID=3400273 RepID=UPI0039185905